MSRIPEPKIKKVRAVVRGVTPLIMHAMSEKSRKQMADKQAGLKTKAKEARNPEQEFIDSIYHMPGDSNRYAFPAQAFKQSMVGSCRLVDGIKMTEARILFFVFGEESPEWVEIVSDAPVMRTDTVTIGQGTTDLRYRPQFDEWSATLIIHYLENAIGAEDIRRLLLMSGAHVGIGEWRAERSGNTFGSFEIVSFDAISDSDDGFGEIKGGKIKGTRTPKKAIAQV